jgi:hypothetical protein
MGVGGRLVVSGEARVLRGPTPVAGGTAYQMEASWLPRRLSGWGFFARFYSGMDYYNLGFLDSIEYLQLGLVWDAGAVEQLLLPDDVPLSAPGPTAVPYPRSGFFDGWVARQLDGLCRVLH